MKAIRTSGNDEVVHGILEGMYFLSDFQIIHERPNPNGLCINITTSRENKVQMISWEMVYKLHLPQDENSLLNTGDPLRVASLQDITHSADRGLAVSLMVELQAYLLEKGANIDFSAELKFSGTVMVVSKN